MYNTDLHFQICERGWGFSTVSSAALNSFIRKQYYVTEDMLLFDRK